MPTKTASQFDEAMLDIYRRAKAEVNYKATIFLSMVVERGGLQTARYLLHTANVSDGYTALYELGRTRSHRRSVNPATRMAEPLL